MDINSKKVIDAPKSAVWKALENPSKVAKGVSEKVTIKDSSDGGFDFEIKFKIGIFSQTVKGSLTVLKKVPLESLEFEFNAKLKIGSVKGSGTIGLTSLGLGEQTEVSFVGTANSGGVLSAMLERGGGDSSTLDSVLNRVAKSIESIAKKES